MKTIVVGLGIFLTSISLPCFSTVTASNPDPDTDTAISPIHALPQEILPLIIGNLALQDFFQAARVCKGWHLARENAVPYSAREEGVFMLHDDHRWSDHLCESALVKTTSFIYKNDGFAFVPFSQRTFPQGSVRLSDEDVAPFFDILYAHAFEVAPAGASLTTLSPQDLLCLEAVFPWSRAVYNPKKEGAKSDALTFLTKTSQNRNLARPNWRLNTGLTTPGIRTLVFTTEEARDYALTVAGIFFPSDIFFTNRDHKIHLVAEEGELLKNGILDTCHTDHHLRHLVISDPNEIVFELASNAFMNLENLRSFDSRGLTKVKRVGYQFLAGCPNLRDFNPRGFRDVQEIDSSYVTREELPLAKEALEAMWEKDPAEAQKNRDDTWCRLKISQRVFSMRPGGHPGGLTIVPPGFNPGHYLLYNPHVMSLALAKYPGNPERFAYEHYEAHGFEEGLTYKTPNDFNVETYLLFNEDVKAYAFTQRNPREFVLKHFITRQQIEARLYKFELPRGFTAAGYLVKNPDLEDYARSDTEKERNNKLKAHYTNSGRHERRQF